MTEQQRFEVVHRYAAFELRRYPAHIVAEVTVQASFDQAGNRAFRDLFGYISGQNRAQESVAMTAPVLQEDGSTADSEKVAMTAPVVQQDAAPGGHTVAFVLPASMTEERAPVPSNPEVTVRTVPASLAAAARFSGRWSESSYEEHRDRLLAAVEAEGLTVTGGPRFARFDPPFKPWFLRRNEVVVDVADPDPGG